VDIVAPAGVEWDVARHTFRLLEPDTTTSEKIPLTERRDGTSLSDTASHLITTECAPHGTFPVMRMRMVMSNQPTAVARSRAAIV